MNKIIVELRGGLANQLFIWASFEKYAQIHECEIVWDDRFVTRPGMPGNRLTELGIVPTEATLSHNIFERIFWFLTQNLTPARVCSYLVAMLPTRRPFRFENASDIARDSKKRLWFRGYHQNPSYFGDIRQELVLHLDTSGLNQAPVIGPYAAIHVRRGDYVAVQRNADRLGVCTVDYFKAAAKCLPRDLPVVVVSDDPDWCQENLANLLPNTKVFRSNSDIEDFEVLRSASAIVLSNSTFSWWAAFTGRPSVVVAPEPWFDSADAGGRELGDIATILLDKRTGEPANRG